MIMWLMYVGVLETSKVNERIDFLAYSKLIDTVVIKVQE